MQRLFELWLCRGVIFQLAEFVDFFVMAAADSSSSVSLDDTPDTPDGFVARAKTRLLISVLFKRIDDVMAKVKGDEFTAVAKETGERLRVVWDKVKGGDLSKPTLTEILAYAAVVERLENDVIVYTK